MTSPVLRLVPRLWISSGLLFLAGCAGETVSQNPPAMPRVVPRAAEPAVDADEAVARARAFAMDGNFPRAVDEIQRVPEQERGASFRRLMKMVANEDPGRSLKLALVFPQGNARWDAIEAGVRVLLARDPDATIAWGLNVEDPTAHFVGLETIASELVARDPRAAVARIQALPSRPERTQLLRLAAARWARTDSDAALGWARGLSQPEKTEMTASVGFEVAQTNPQRAAEIAASLPESRERGILFTAVAETWIARDSKAAEAWLRSLPAGPSKDAAWAGIASATGPVRSRRVPGLPSQYRSPRVGGGGASGAVALPAGEQRAAALWREFEERLRSAPASAANWLATLPAPDVSDEMLRQLTREWMRTDPAAARAWLELNVPSTRWPVY